VEREHTPGFASVQTREWPLHVRSGRRLKKKWMSMADVAATKASSMLKYCMLGGLRVCQTSPSCSSLSCCMN
jgi:hypothetical protein